MKTLISDVNRGLEERLRLAAVAAGYLPDKLLYMPSDAAGYETAKQAIRDAGRPVVEIYGPGSNPNRDVKRDANVYVTFLMEEPADAGTGQDFVYEFNAQDMDYDKTLSPDTRYDLSYQISYVTETEETASAIQDIMRSAFGVRGYVDALGVDGITVVSKFKFFRTTPFEVPGTDYLERGSRYEAKWVDLDGFRPLGKIAPFDFTKFDLDVVPTARETLFKKIVETFDANGVVTGYDDVYKLGLSVDEDLQGNKYVSGPGGEQYKINPDGTITYLSPNL